jgi:uncharacterized protein (DUF2062 family)
MDSYEKVAYGILGGLAALWLLAMLAGMIAAFPFGLIGLLVVLAVGLLFVKVLRERRANREDDHYDRTVEK